MPRVVEPVPLADLPSWPTKRLLALRNRLLRCEPRLEDSDVSDLAELHPTVIRFKEDPRWDELYRATLALLDEREHVSSSSDRARERRRRAATRTGERKPPPKRR